MWIGVAFGILTTFIWASSYIFPAMLPDYGAAALMIARAPIVGLCAVLAIAATWKSYSHLTRSDWKTAYMCGLIGHFLQPILLFTCVEYAGIPVGALCWGGVPVSVALVSNYRARLRNRPFVPYGTLVVPLALIVVGFIVTNYTELEQLSVSGTRSMGEFFFGLACGIVQIGLWTWYPIKNAEWMQDHPETSTTVWTCAQLAILLPIGLVAYPLVAWLTPSIDGLFGARPWFFLAIVLWCSIVTTFVAMFFFNICSARVPTALVGQLMIFETVFSILMGLVYDWKLPTVMLTAGVILLLAGVVISLRIFARFDEQQTSSR